MLKNDDYIDPKILFQYEGKCIGLLGNKVVCSGEDAGEVLRVILKKYKGKKISLACIPVRSAKIVY